MFHDVSIVLLSLDGDLTVCLIRIHQFVCVRDSVYSVQFPGPLNVGTGGDISAKAEF